MLIRFMCIIVIYIWYGMWDIYIYIYVYIVMCISLHGYITLERATITQLKPNTSAHVAEEADVRKLRCAMPSTSAFMPGFWRYLSVFMGGWLQCETYNIQSFEISYIINIKIVKISTSSETIFNSNITNFYSSQKQKQTNTLNWNSKLPHIINFDFLNKAKRF